MRWFNVLLDNLDQSPGAQLESRRTLVGGLALIAAVTRASQPASSKKRRKKRCKRRKQCGKGCCNADSCFAASVDPVNSEPLTFACCPAEKLCRSTKPPYPDQCCYPDETCNPTLTEDPLTQTICCRPCNGECCLNLNEECIDGACTPINTARLPRTRRPG